MFNLKPNDPLEDLITGAETIITERARVLETIGKAETRLREAEGEVAAARERVTNEEFDAAQREGGLAVASKAAQQVLAEAELQAKSARFRLDGLRAGLNPIEEKLETAWRALEGYRDEFISGKIDRASQEFDEALKALVRAIFKARALGMLGIKWSKIHQPFHPGGRLRNCYIENPYTHTAWVQPPGYVWTGDRLIASRSHWRTDPEVAAFYDAIDAIKQRVDRVGVLLGKVALTVVEEEAQSEGDAPPEAMTEA